MTAGTGYRYLMETVATGDGDRRMSTPLTRYYAEPGTPPGRWMGAGLTGLDGGHGLAAGSQVREEQLFNLLGMACDSVTGAPLGTAPMRAEPGNRERIRTRLQQLPRGLPAAERAERIEKIHTEERTRPTGAAGKAVAGFDLTFSVPKSVSAVWAVADARTQELIATAHQAAIADALAWAEANVFATRTGHGGATRVGVRGVIAAAFDHYDSRANDPHLHTHVVIANRVQSRLDDKWRTLDSRELFRAVVALSELHQGLLMDRLTGVLGVGWDGRARRHSPVPQWETTGVPDALRAEFSRRADDIDAAKDKLVDAYITEHGHEPSAAVVIKLRQQATLDSRPDKTLHPLADLTAQWRNRARPFIGPDTEGWARDLPRAFRPAVRSDDLPAGEIQRIAEQTLDAVAAKRATFTRWNVFAEAQRQLHPVRFATAKDRVSASDRVTDSALGLSLLLTAPGPQTKPSRTTSARYTTREIYDAEERLLAASRDDTGPAIAHPAIDDPDRAGEVEPAPEQVAAVAQIAGSGRRVDVLVGAAGAGKTSTMHALATTWQARFGPGSVIGLAPSAAAADVLASELGLATENTAKWLAEVDLEPHRLARLHQLAQVLEHLPRDTPSARRVAACLRMLDNDIDRWRMKPDQLVIVDEASLAGTRTLDRLAAQARTANAKLVLVGDWAQLSAVDAGGAFGLLARDRRDTPELREIRRFTHDWEKTASLELRAGAAAAIATYNDHGRVHEADRGAVLDNAYTAWRSDRLAGKASLLIASDRETVRDLNARARADRVAAGEVTRDAVALADGSRAGVGDWVVTRRNNRRTRTGDGWVKNGDTWTVAARHDDGSLDLARSDGAGTVTVSADYVREHVELGYAATAHRAQGRTVDTAHAVVTSPAMTRETLYVAMTRGRTANHAWVATDHITDIDTTHGPRDQWPATDLLTTILDNAGADLSAHETLNLARRTLLTEATQRQRNLPGPESTHAAQLAFDR